MRATPFKRCGCVPARVVSIVAALALSMLLAACGMDAFVPAQVDQTAPPTQQLPTPEPELTDLAIGPPVAQIAIGSTQAFTATALYSDGSRQDVTAQLAWTTTNATVASVASAPGIAGLATAHSSGSTTINASLEGRSASAALTVTAATLVSISVAPGSSSVAKGTTQQLHATGHYSDNTTQDLTAAVSWTPSDPLIATVSNSPGSNGLAGAVGIGSATITASLGSVDGSATLTVTSATLVSLTVAPAGTILAKGLSTRLTAIGTFTDNSTQDLSASVTWSSSDTTLATISNAAGIEGQADALQPGTVTITATRGAISGATTLSVTAATLVTLAITPTSATITNGTQKQFVATGTYTDNSTQDLTAVATWSSSDTAVATISNASGTNGLATSAGVGTTSIGALVSGVISPVITLTVINGTAYAYVANQLDNTISQFKIDAGGALTSLGIAAAGARPSFVAADPKGRFAYVLNQSDNTVSVYQKGPGGILSPIGSAPTGSDPLFCAADSSGQYLYVANLVDSTISQFSIAADGALTSQGDIVTGSAPYAVAVDPMSRYVYAVNFLDNNVSQYRIGMNGVLTPLGTTPTEDAPASIAVDPTGRYVYVTNLQAATISQYSIGSSGSLSSLGTVPAGGGADSVAVDPTGHYVYAANYYDGTVSQYTIGPGGVLSPLGSVPSGIGPYSVSVDPSGRYVYVANSSDSNVSRYSIDVNGTLSPLGTEPTGSYPVSVATAY